MELLAWKLRQPNAVTMELQSFFPQGLQFFDINDMPFTTLLIAEL